METEKTIPATYEERMRIATISDKTRDYMAALDKVQEIWDILDRILERDCKHRSESAPELREKMSDALNKISDFLLCTIAGNLNLLDMIIEELALTESEA